MDPDKDSVRQHYKPEAAVERFAFFDRRGHEVAQSATEFYCVPGYAIEKSTGDRYPVVNIAHVAGMPVQFHEDTKTIYVFDGRIEPAMTEA